MRLQITAALLALCTVPAFAVTFDVHKATASFGGFIKDTSGPVPVLVPYKLTSKQIINLARGRGLKDVVPKNEILAGAGEFDKIFVTPPDASAPRRLIVWDTAGNGGLGAPLGNPIIVADTATVLVAENHFSAKGGFKRVGFGDGLVQANGDANNGFVSGLLQFNVLFKRTIVRSGIPRPATPLYTMLMFGRINLTDATVAKEFFVNKATLTVSGKRIGQFDE